MGGILRAMGILQLPELLAILRWVRHMGDKSRRQVIRAVPGLRLLATVVLMTVGMMLWPGIATADMPAPSADTASAEADIAQGADLSAVTSPTPEGQDVLAIRPQPGFAQPDGCRIGA